LTDEDIQKVQDTVSSWRTGEGYEDIEGYCKGSTSEEIEKNSFILTPGRYVGFADEEDDGVPFNEKMNSLLTDLRTYFSDAESLDENIKNNLQKLGFSNKNE